MRTAASRGNSAVPSPFLAPKHRSSLQGKERKREMKQVLGGVCTFDGSAADGKGGHISIKVCPEVEPKPKCHFGTVPQRHS